MAENKPEIYISEIKSDTDSLSARAVHDSLLNLLRSELEGGEVFLKALVPKRDGDMFAHVSHVGPVDGGLISEGAVGIPEIHKSGESDALSAKYPLFVDKGTGIFGGRDFIKPKPPHKFMEIPANRGDPGFLAYSKGQRGRGFMFATFSLMVAMLQVNGEKFKAELTTKLNLDKALT